MLVLTAAFVDDLSVLFYSQNETQLPGRDFFNEGVNKSSAPLFFVLRFGLCPYDFIPSCMFGCFKMYSYEPAGEQQTAHFHRSRETLGGSFN